MVLIGMNGKKMLLKKLQDMIENILLLLDKSLKIMQIGEKN